jgi:hypothetical protein
MKPQKQYKLNKAYSRDSTQVFVSGKTKNGKGYNDKFTKEKPGENKLTDEVESKSVKRMRGNFKKSGKKMFAGKAGNTGGFKTLQIENKLSLKRMYESIVDEYAFVDAEPTHETKAVGDLNDFHYILVQNDIEVRSILNDIGMESEDYPYLLVRSKNGRYIEIWGLYKPVADETAYLLYRENDINESFNDWDDEEYDDDEDFGDFYQEAACPMCSGEGSPIGTLGNTAHYRCQNCGWTFSNQETIADDEQLNESIVTEMIHCEGCDSDHYTNSPEQCYSKCGAGPFCNVCQDDHNGQCNECVCA